MLHDAIDRGIGGIASGRGARADWSYFQVGSIDPWPHSRGNGTTTVGNDGKCPDRRDICDGRTAIPIGSKMNPDGATVDAFISNIDPGNMACPHISGKKAKESNE